MGTMVQAGMYETQGPIDADEVQWRQMQLCVLTHGTRWLHCTLVWQGCNGSYKQWQDGNKLKGASMRRCACGSPDWKNVKKNSEYTMLGMNLDDRGAD